MTTATIDRDNVQQVDLFDLLEPTDQEPKFKVGDSVIIKKVDELVNPDAETIGYLNDYRFGGQAGTILEVIAGTKICYKVSTKIGKAITYETEIREG